MRSIFFADTFEPNCFECTACVPYLHHLDTGVIVHIINDRVIVIEYDYIRGCEIIVKSDHLPNRAVCCDACLEVKAELELLI